MPKHNLIPGFHLKFPQYRPTAKELLELPFFKQARHPSSLKGFLNKMQLERTEGNDCCGLFRPKTSASPNSLHIYRVVLHAASLGDSTAARVIRASAPRRHKRVVHNQKTVARKALRIRISGASPQIKQAFQSRSYLEQVVDDLVRRGRKASVNIAELSSASLSSGEIFVDRLNLQVYQRLVFGDA